MDEFDEDFDEGFSFGFDEGDPKRENIYGVATSEPPNHSFIIEEMGKEHILEEDYMTDELDNGIN